MKWDRKGKEMMKQGKKGEGNDIKQGQQGKGNDEVGIERERKGNDEAGIERERK